MFKRLLALVFGMTEMLRAKMNANYAPIYKPIKDAREKILSEL